MSNVGLYVTCLVDNMRPSIGWSAVKLLEDAGCTVHVPTQTCCGQPSFNGGDKTNAKALAWKVIETFERFDYVVAPSGSCAAMIKCHYPELFKDDPDLLPRATALAAKTHELVSFLHNTLGITSIKAKLEATVTYHDSCSGLRELNVQNEPRQLLKSMEGLNLVEMKDADVCCGFGGTFAVKYPEISTTIVDRKVANATEKTPDLLLAGDLGCLMNMAGRLKRQGSPIQCRHIAEVLAGHLDTPAIGHSENHESQRTSS